MAAGNTVSVNPPFAPVGSESEAYHGIELHSEPEPALGSGSDHQLKTLIGHKEFHPTAVTWERVR